METSIRFIRIDKRAIRPALCFRGRNRAYAVINDEGRVIRAPSIGLIDHDKAAVVMGPVGLGQATYPIDRFVERFSKLGQEQGVTKRAEFFMKKALNGGVEDDAILPPDEVSNAPTLKEFDGIGDDPLVLKAIANSVPRKPKEPVPATPVAPVASKRSSKSGKPGKPGSRTSGAAIVARIAAELKLEPTKLRKLLRSKGLSAPYDDEAQIRKAIGR